MKSFTFGIHFRFDTEQFYETFFTLDLSKEEVCFVKTFLKENRDQPFWAFEFENEALFSRMMKAHVDAILSYVNTNVIEPGEEPFMEETVDWDCVWAEFCWPRELQIVGQK